VGQLPVTGPAQGRAGSQHFPTTQATWIVEASRGDDSRLGELAARIIERYAQPLEAYAQGSSLREIGEPRELVHGFLLAKFATPGACRAYLEAWNASGLTLRRWMMNGLLLHVRGVVRDAQRSRERPLDAAVGALASDEPDPSAAFERAWARAIVSEACAQVEQALIAEGRDRAWRVFRLHTLDGRPYGELESEFGLTRQQMADLVRGVTTRLRARVRELLDEEGRFGGDDGVDEIVRVLSG
jgi:DNA-directed RNA polymerase specialized sigma24 family protein